MVRYRAKKLGIHKYYTSTRAREREGESSSRSLSSSEEDDSLEVGLRALHQSNTESRYLYPMPTPDDRYQNVNALDQWHYYLDTYPQFGNKTSFGPMAFVHEYCTFEALAQAGCESQSMSLLSQTFSKVQTMLNDQHVTLTLAFMFLRRVTICCSLSAGFTRRVLSLLDFILDSGKNIFGSEHPIVLLLYEMHPRRTTLVQSESLDALVFRCMANAIRCVFHKAELALVMATHAMWGRQLTQAEAILKELVSTYSTDQLADRSFKSRVTFFISITVRQCLAGVWMRMGRFSQAEHLLRKLMSWTKALPIVRLYIMSRLSEALYRQEKKTEADLLLSSGLSAIEQLPNGHQRLRFRAEFECQLADVRVSDVRTANVAEIWYSALAGVLHSRFEESMDHYTVNWDD